MSAVSQPLASAFVAKNRLMYDRLVTFLDFAPERFTLGFVSVNFGRDRVALIEALQADPRDADLQIVALDFDDQELRYFKDALVEQLATVMTEPAKKLVLMITGLESAIGLLGEYPLVLQDLNYIRDAFVNTVPYPIVFLLPDGALTRLAKFAPDLWAWRKGVFGFSSSEADDTIDKPKLVDLSGMDLRNVRLKWVVLTGAKLFRANLSGACLGRAELNQTNLQEADLTNSDLSYANLCRADLTDANLKCANLRHAILIDANLTGADLRGIQFDGADFTGAIIKDAKLPPGLLANLTPILKINSDPIIQDPRQIQI
jgi:hypothetical protein